MLALHIALYSLLGTGLVFAIVELGLSAYVTTFWGGKSRSYSYDPYEGYTYKTVNASVPGILAFLLFTAIWTILFTVAAAVLPWHYGRKGLVTKKLNTILGIGFLVVYFVTSVFWLACFADLASLINGAAYTSDYYNALIAFAVLNWLIYLALFILGILAVVGVLFSDWAGHQSMRKERAAPQDPGLAPVQQVPMSTTPVAAPSELSTRDAEALHNQPPSQSLSTSSPSAVTSAELDGGSSVHDHQMGHR
ncbi:hypothetical protein N7532_002235 [Penicillium argentinense]|uniref:MARVEL domain-containing protein n=1 Tax=Penicillium argentinense TaxID=1131581 RepID=A0A9W9KKE6_9EURO|nr:uncharacterized protein N7532_002235 [Penicillium argentinense]KAJ5109590.1 hypothetical protein N7532_002235 [Penicillium argentinense]